MTNMGAAFFCFAMFLIAYLGLSVIKTSVVRILFIMHSLGVFSMLVVPALWYSVSGFENFGFLGFGFDSLTITHNLPFIYFAVIYTYVVTTFGFFFLARAFPERLWSIRKSTEPPGKSLYISLSVLFGICFIFFYSYYGTFNSILLLRNRESFVLPIHFELLRGAVIGACTFSTLTLATTRFTRHPITFSVTLCLFVFSLALMAGFGSRNLLVFPISAVFLALNLNRDRTLVRRNYSLAAVMILLFVGLTVLQSNVRDSGIGQGDISDIRLSSFFLAFDQFSSLFIALQTYDAFPRLEERLPLSMVADIFLHFFPRSWFEWIGLTKMVHINYLEWNANVTGAVNSNVTPSYVGQALIENRFLGLFTLPFEVLIVVLILLKILAMRLVRKNNFVVFLTGIALVSGGLFNVVRMFSGAYLLYFFVFVSIAILIDKGLALLRRRKGVLG